MPLDQETNSASLTYQRRARHKVHPAPEYISRDNGLLIDVGPMPEAVFITQLVTWSAGVVVGAVACWFLMNDWRRTASLKAWIVFPSAFLISIFILVRLARYRAVSRKIFAAKGELCFSDAKTGGKLFRVRPGQCERIRIRRIWWRPWLFEMFASSNVKFMSARSSNPVALLLDSDRALLEDIATRLRTALELAPPEIVGENK